ncbi:hypothetical protein CD034_03205 [Staphylococcus hominis subsp. hominis]|uniref:hypothetical protein n=1 Tax=Staphylococcus hominis TaxID=1290 RepID=UPI000CD2393A|nr:hypothetical protein [Staphylococcus hominis]AYY65687.1 hypothetical protein EGX58_01665 [Staphylococcus hominis]PNZ32574.1 hypothetical protein CD034_03205 [Staphylococcus hominis subsp. hominis]SUM42083.1 Uncharacterised protein [Staphylococcus hominis]
MKVEGLKVGQKIRFAASEYSLSYPGIVEEFTSTTEAQNYLYQDRSVIARKCNKRLEEDGLTYIWAKDYEVMTCC